VIDRDIPQHLGEQVIQILATRKVLEEGLVFLLGGLLVEAM
jgi:hypothetical protein